MRTLILFFIFSVSFFNGFSQSLEEKQNMFKYWNYRDMLTRKFLSIPEHAPSHYEQLESNPDIRNERYLRSKSLPMQFYQFYDWCRNDGHHDEPNWQIEDGSPDCPNEYMVKASDATTHLGWYIAVLATEWKLLERRGLPTKRTEEELYWAVKAVGRLDEYAEAYMKYGTMNFDENDLLVNKNFGNKQLDGFFMRDDCFAWRRPNQTLTADKLKDARTGQEIKILDSDYNLGWRNGGDKKNYVSQDQIIHLFMGFLLVKRLVPDWVKPYGPESSILEMVQNQTTQIMNYLEAHDYYLNIPEIPAQVDRGAWINVYREPLAMVGEEITGFPYAQRERARQLLNPVLTAYTYVWFISQYPYINLYDEDKQYQLMMLAAMTNSWRLLYFPPLFRNIFGIPVNDLLNPNTTRFALGLAGAHTSNRKYIYSYLYNLLYPSFFTIIESDFIIPNMSEAIKDAPCEGPALKFRTDPLLLDQLSPQDPNYRDDYLRSANKGWRGPWRWVHALGGIDGSEAITGQYNGLDYMLAYNLKLLVHNNNNAPSYFENQWNYELVNRTFDGQNHKTVIGINSVYIDNVNFNDGSRVEVYSANQIHLNGRISSEGDLAVHLKITDEINDVCETIYPNLLVVPNPNDGHIDDSTAFALFQEQYPDSIRPISEIYSFVRDSILCLTQDELDSLLTGNGSPRILAKIDSCIQTYDSTYVPQNFGNRKDLEAFIQPARPIAINVYPNPFQSGFDIRFTLPEQEKITITVLNGLGIPVLEVVQEQSYPAGTHEITIGGSTLTAGMYCCKVEVGNKTVQTFNLIKTQ